MSTSTCPKTQPWFLSTGLLHILVSWWVETCIFLIHEKYPPGLIFFSDFLKIQSIFCKIPLAHWPVPRYRAPNLYGLNHLPCSWVFCVIPVISSPPRCWFYARDSSTSHVWGGSTHSSLIDCHQSLTVHCNTASLAIFYCSSKLATYMLAPPTASMYKTFSLLSSLFCLSP